MTHRKFQLGFTLVELMIVMAIVGVLVGIAIPNLLSYRVKAQDSAAKQEAFKFYASALVHYDDKDEAIAFSESTLPDGFLRNEEITYGGSMVVNGVGVTTGTMTFSHSNSSITYTLTCSTGRID